MNPRRPGLLTLAILVALGGYAISVSAYPVSSPEAPPAKIKIHLGRGNTVLKGKVSPPAPSADWKRGPSSRLVPAQNPKPFPLRGTPILK